MEPVLLAYRYPHTYYGSGRGRVMRGAVAGAAASVAVLLLSSCLAHYWYALQRDGYAILEP